MTNARDLCQMVFSTSGSVVTTVRIIPIHPDDERDSVEVSSVRILSGIKPPTRWQRLLARLRRQLAGEQ